MAIKTKFKLVWGTCDFKMLGVTFNVDIDKMIKLNFEEKLISLEKMISHWKRRYLTPIGKITVIKSLFLPLFTHLFISLPNPPTKIIDKINNLLFDFLWNGPAKIKKDVIINDYEQGGLRMVNLSKFIQGLKCSWIRRILYSDSNWKSLTEHFLDLDKLFLCGKNYPEIASEKTKNAFWKDALISFAQFIDKFPVQSDIDILKCPIFYNHNLQIGGKSFFFKSWFDKGIRFVNDLYHNGKPLTLEDLEHCYNIKVNPLHYLSVSKVTQHYMRTKTQQKKHLKIPLPFIPHILEPFTKIKSGGRVFYDHLNNNLVHPTSKAKWETQYNISSNQWKLFYSQPFNLTKDSSLQWLQIRILHRIIPVNKYLFTLKLKNSQECTFCKSESETIQHLFYNCVVTKRLIDTIESILLNGNITVQWNETSFLFSDNSREVAILSLYMKQYIFIKRNLGLLPDIHSFKKFIKHKLDVNRYIAERKNDVDNFEVDFKLLKCIQEHI